MKMSDFFNLPMDVGSSLNNVGTACTELADCDFYLADFRRENTLEEAHSMAKAAAYAIDHHDALVAMNKELVEALTNLINDIGSKHSIHVGNNIGGSTRRALNCAKIVLANSDELNHEG
jgi:predicted metal-dependent hydrolase